MQSGYVTNNGVKIYFEVYGEQGDYLCFLHGNGESIEYFKKQIDCFKDTYRVVCVDSRGHGKSDFGQSRLEIELLSEDLLAVFNYLKIPKASIAGFSDGANIAMMFASKHTERVNKLILIGGNTKPQGCKLKFRVLVNISFCLYSLAARFDKAIEAQRELFRLMAKQPKISIDQLRTIKNPTLVMAGDKDIIKRSETAKIADSIENSQLMIIEDSDHFIPFKKPELFNEKLKSFLID